MATITLATPKDAKIVATLVGPVQELHADQHPHLFKYPIDTIALATFFQKQLTAEQNAIYIAWDEKNQPVGYIWCVLQQRPENLIRHSYNRVSIDQISVNPESHGKGIGKQLLLAAEEFAAEHAVIDLELSTWAFNIEAHGFFEQMGYTKYKQNMWKTLEV